MGKLAFHIIQQNNDHKSSASTVSSGTNDHSRSAVSTSDLFAAARSHLKPGCQFRTASYLYAERKIAVFFLIHFVATIIVWGHFATIKWNEQIAAVPTTAPSYLWKRIVPTLEFGAMHAILFTMALLPLTMCRLSIASLSESALNEYIPLNRTLRMHIHLGYTMVLTLCFATIVFFTFFGKMCANGEEKFCNLLTSEIMTTGYGILAAIIIVGVTSYFRHRIPYELFYVVHHLVFIMYAITIAHTLDSVHRSGARDRSQSFKWFSSTLLLYVCDRAALYLNHRYDARIVKASTLKGSNGSRMIMLNIRRPVLLRFRPGQYAYLRVQSIDIHWHPFSIASGPDSESLEFCIEVFKDKSWSAKLWDMLDRDNAIESEVHDMVRSIEVMGPYGTSLAHADRFSHGLAVGTGTGIVPILSFFRQHVEQLSQLSPERHLEQLEYMHRRVHEVESAESARKGSFLMKLVHSCSSVGQQTSRGDALRDRIASYLRTQLLLDESPLKAVNQSNLRKMKHAAKLATRTIYASVLLSLLPVLGVSLIGISISWTTITVEPFTAMITAWKLGTLIFQVCFTFVSLFIFDCDSMLSIVDLVICVITPFVDWFWFLELRLGRLRTSYLTTFCILAAYMTLRLWTRVVKPKKSAWQASRYGFRGSRPLERLEIVWVTRSATLVSELYPEISQTWDRLVKAWGSEKAEAVCRISIHVTDRNKDDLVALQSELSDTALYRNGCIHFERPNFLALIENHTIDLIHSHRHSYSLLAFCGSPQLAREVHQCKIQNDMVTAITGYKNHQMEFVSESYGGSKADKSKLDDDDDVSQTNPNFDDKRTFSPLTTNRNEILFESSSEEYEC